MCAPPDHLPLHHLQATYGQMTTSVGYLMTRHRHHDNHHRCHHRNNLYHHHHIGYLRFACHPHQTECHPLTGVHLHLEITLRLILLLETVLHLMTNSLTSVVMVTFLLPSMGPAEWTTQCTQPVMSWTGIMATGSVGGPPAPLHTMDPPPVTICLLSGACHLPHNSAKDQNRTPGVHVAPTCLGPPHLSDQGSCKCRAISVFC